VIAETSKRPGEDRKVDFTNEAKRLLKTKEIVLLQIAIAKRFMKTNDLILVKPRGY
jgi:hypothetical protein